MNDIAQMTYNQNDFIEIMEMLDKRLNDKGKNWRHVFKSLTVLDYCLHQGSENVVIYFRDNIYIIKTLKEFQYIDEDGKDQGANVRQKAKDITNLLQDEGRLREERRSRASMRDRMIRGANAGDEDDEDENDARRRSGTNGLAGKRPNRDEDELKKAIEESKKSLAQERRDAEERDFQHALKLSEEEEARRKQDVDNSNASALFDDTQQLPSPGTASNNPFPLVDPTPYATGLQPQFTAVQPQFTSVQPQFTSFNPYQQQAEQEAAQAEFMRQQQLFLLQQQQAQQQQQQQEEIMRQQQLFQMQQQQQQQQQQLQNQSLFAPSQPLTAQPTGFGSNNPFAPSPAPSGFNPSPRPTQQQGPSPSFNLPGTYETHSPSRVSSLSSSPAPTQNQNQNRPIQVKTKKELGENEAHLAALFANRDDGQDTFGNIGSLRYGYTDAGRQIVAQRTGASPHNPFAQQQQQQQQAVNPERPFFDI